MGVKCYGSPTTAVDTFSAPALSGAAARSVHAKISGVGSDVMKPIAAPIIGGMITSTIHVLIIAPVIFEGVLGTGPACLPEPPDYSVL